MIQVLNFGYQHFKGRILVLLILFLCIFTARIQSCYAEDLTESKLNESTVLVVCGQGKGDNATEAVVSILQYYFLEAGVQRSNIFIEYLDAYRFSSPLVLKENADVFRKKYGNVNVDLVIALSQAAVDFLIQELGFISPQVPMLVSLLDLNPIWFNPNRPTMTIPHVSSIRKNLELSQTLFPSRDTLVIIGGNDKYSQRITAQIRQEAEDIFSFKEVIDTIDMTKSEMLKLISTLSDTSIAIFASYYNDVSNQYFGFTDIATKLGKTSSVPILGLMEDSIVSGFFGGVAYLAADIGHRTALIAVDYLIGKAVIDYENLYPDEPFSILLSWDQIKKFDVDPSRLSQVPVFLNKSPGLWRTHRIVIIEIFLVFVCLITVILILVNNYNKLKKSVLLQERLREDRSKSEEKYRRLFETMSSGVLYQEIDGTVSSANSAAERVFGLFPCTKEKVISDYDQWKMIYEDGSTVSAGALPFELAFHDAKKVGPVVRGVYNHEQERYIWLYITAIPLIEPGKEKPQQVCTIFDDVTELINAKNAFALVNERLEKLIETTPGIVNALWFHPDGTFSFPIGGQRIADYFILSSERLKQNAQDFFDLVHPDDKEELLGSLQVSLSGLTSWYHEWRMLHPEKGELWIEGHSIPKNESDGGVLWYGVLNDISYRKKTESLLKLRLKEKDILIKELFHRTFNNLQIIQALMSYKMLSHPDISSEEFMNDIHGHISIMALIQRELYNAEDLSNIKLEDCLPSIIQAILEHYQVGDKIQTVFHLEPMALLLDTAIPLAIALNELVNYSIRRGFHTNDSNNSQIILNISTRTANSEVKVLTVETSNCLWLPLEDSSTEFSGLRLAKDLIVHQLDGDLQFGGEEGTTCVITFSENRYEDRLSIFTHK